MGVLFFKGCGGGNVKSGSLQGSPRFARGTKPRTRSVPPARRGNLQEGVTNCCFFVNFGLAIGISRSSASCSQGFEALSALRRDNTS